MPGCAPQSLQSKFSSQRLGAFGTLLGDKAAEARFLRVRALLPTWLYILMMTCGYPFFGPPPPHAFFCAVKISSLQSG